MTNPDVSRAVAAIKARMELEPGPVLDDLIAAAEKADTVADLPRWALNVLSILDAPPDQQVIADAAGRMVDDDGLDGISITPPPRG